MKYMLIVPVMAAVFFLYGFIFPPAPVTTTSCYLDVNSPSVRVMAEEINVEMVPVVGFNNRIFYYQGITHNLAKVLHITALKFVDTFHFIKKKKKRKENTFQRF